MNYKEEFKWYYNTEQSIVYSKQNTLIVFDTNALLNLFRLPKFEGNIYLETINKNINQIYIPYLVALEFHHNYENIKNEQNVNSKKTKSGIFRKLNEMSNEIIKEFNNYPVLNTRLSAKKIVNLKNEIDTIINSTNLKDTIVKEINEIELDWDETFNKLVTLIEPITGDSYDQKFIDFVSEKGEIRYSKKIAPGFNDINKTEFRLSNEFVYAKKYGDLIIWFDIIKKVKTTNNIKQIIFVTSDGKSKKKSDMLKLKNNNYYSFRDEMIHELKEKTGAKLIWMDEEKFINEFGGLDITIQINKILENTNKPIILEKMISDILDSQELKLELDFFMNSHFDNIDYIDGLFSFVGYELIDRKFEITHSDYNVETVNEFEVGFELYLDIEFSAWVEPNTYINPELYEEYDCINETITIIVDVFYNKRDGKINIINSDYKRA